MSGETHHTPKLQLYAGDVQLGTSLGEYVIQPSTVTLFRFSAITWNPHRIHYDAAYAATEGYGDVLVHSHLHGCWLAQLVTAWAGPRARIREFSWQNRRYATAGEVLRCTGEVVAVQGRIVECELKETNSTGVVCAPGRALVELPLPGQADR